MYRYEKYKTEILYYLMRMCREEKLRNVVKDFRYLDEEISKMSPDVVKAFLDKIKGLGESDIHSKVEKDAKASLNRHRNNNENFFIYVIAGVISMANIF